MIRRAVRDKLSIAASGRGGVVSRRPAVGGPGGRPATLGADVWLRQSTGTHEHLVCPESHARLIQRATAVQHRPGRPAEVSRPRGLPIMLVEESEVVSPDEFNK